MPTKNGSQQPAIVQSPEALLIEQAKIAKHLIAKVRESHVGVKDVALFVIEEFVGTFNLPYELTPSQRVNMAVEAVSTQPNVEGIPHDWQHGSGMMMGRDALKLAKEVQDKRKVMVKELGKWMTMNRHRAICQLNDAVAERDRNHALRQQEKQDAAIRSQRTGTLTLIHDSGHRKASKDRRPHRRNANDGKRRKAS